MCAFFYRIDPKGNPADFSYEEPMRYRELCIGFKMG
jgi:hypothetical protein